MALGRFRGGANGHQAMDSRAAGVLLLWVAACGGAGSAPSARPESDQAPRAGLSSRELAMRLFKGNRSPPDVTPGELPPPEPFMPPPPEADLTNALTIEVRTSDVREAQGQRTGSGPGTAQSFTLMVHTTPVQRVSLGRWHYGLCWNAREGVAQVMCTGNGATLSFTLLRRKVGSTVDVYVHEGGHGVGALTYREGVVAQVRVPRERAIHLVRTGQGEPEPFEETRYFPAE